MDIQEIRGIIIKEAFHVHSNIGPGMLENVYKTCLYYRLTKMGLYVEKEKSFPVVFEEVRMELGYRVDLVVEKCIVIDTKTIDSIGPLQVAQMLTYLRFLNLRNGLIINFNTVHLKDGIKRVLNGY